MSDDLSSHQTSKNPYLSVFHSFSLSATNFRAFRSVYPRWGSLGGTMILGMILAAAAAAPPLALRVEVQPLGRGPRGGGGGGGGGGVLGGTTRGGCKGKVFCQE